MHAYQSFGARVKASLLLAVGLLLPFRVAAASNLSLYLCENNRILRFSPPFSTGMSADAVVGATNFDTVTPGLGPDLLSGPVGIDHDGAGNLFVADSVNNRVLEFTQPITTGESASLVIGQPDFTTNNVGFAINQTRNPRAVAIDRRGSGALYVAVEAHVRAFPAPFSNGMNASLQLGNDGSTAQFIEPDGLSLNSSGALFVSDLTNFRVLDYKPPIKGNQLANVVLGANSLDHPGQGVFRSPAGSAFDSKGDFWVADFNTNRVLEFIPPFYNGKPPALVIGQPDFRSSQPNLTQSGLYIPNDVAFDGDGDLWVVDSGNARVLEFVPPFSNGMNASVVIGQTDFTSDVHGVSASQISFPSALTFAP
jgi:sugar lactone lactonase YvrE